MVTRVIGVRIDGSQARRGALQVRRALRDITRAGDRTRRSIRGVGRAIFSLKGAFAALGVGLVSKALVDTAINLERVTRGLKQATGSAENGAQAMAFISTEVDRLGLSLLAAETGFVGISAAARGTSLEGEEIRQIFLGISEASAALGLSSEQTKGALVAIEQIISKGKVSAEELRGQLGERLPGAFQIAARAIGVGTEQLDKFLVAGKLIATDFIPLFARQLRLEMGEAAKEAADQLQGALNQMGNAFERLKRVIATSGALDPFQDAVVAITEIVEDPAFLKGAESAFRALGNVMKAVAQNVDLVLIALKSILIGFAGGIFVRLAVGSIRMAAGLRLAQVAAIAAAAGLTGMARASAAATAGMTALGIVSRTLGGPIGIFIAVASATVFLIDKFNSAEDATRRFREELENLGKTPLQIETKRITAQIEMVKAALADAQDRADDAAAAADRPQAQRAPTGRFGQQLAIAASAATKVAGDSAKQAAADIAFFTEKLGILEEMLAGVGTTTGVASAEFIAMQEALREKLMGATDDAAKMIEKARESLDGMIGSLTEAVDTYGMTAAATLKYRLVTGDLSAAVASLGEEGSALRDELIRLAEAYERLEVDSEANLMVQETFTQIYEDTRTAAEKYADELERLAALQLSLAAAGQLSAEQLAELPEIFERLRQQAEDTKDGAGQSFDAMTEFAIAAARSMETAFSDFFFSVMQGEFDNMAANFKRTIDRMMADFLASQLLGLFAGFAGKGGILGAIGVVAGGTGKRHGGPAQEGQTFMVGEAGPEVFTAPADGHIIPNRSLGSFNARNAIGQGDGMRGFNVPIRNDQTPTAGMNTLVPQGIDRIDGELARLTTGRTKVNMLPGRVHGGPVFRGQPIVAGEAGPELFVGSGAGRGGGGITVNMTVNATDADSFRQSQGQILAEMSRLLQGARARNG